MDAHVHKYEETPAMGVECNNFKKVNVEVPPILHLDWRGIWKPSMQHCLYPCPLPPTPKLNLKLGVTFPFSSWRPTLPQPKKKKNVSATVSASIPLLLGRPKQNQENQDEGREEHSVNEEVREKLAYLESIGVDTYSAITENPSISATSLNSIQSVVKFLQTMGMLDTDLGRLFGICPEALTASVSRQLRPIFTFLLREVQIPAIRLRRVIYRRPRLLACSVKEQLRPTLYFLQRLGFTDVGKYSFLLPCSVEGKLMPRLQYFQNLGLSYKDAVSMFLKFPPLFNYSVEGNFRPKLDYLVNDMGGNVDDLKAFPQYFAFSLEKRIKPRHRFVVENDIELPLSVMLRAKDEDFYHRLKDLCDGSLRVNQSIIKENHCLY